MGDAQVGDIYADSTGKLWRVTLAFAQPAVEVEEVEVTPYGGTGDSITTNAGKHRLRGSATDAMWTGFEKILRKAATA